MSVEIILNQMEVKSGNSYIPVMAGSLVSHEDVKADVEEWLDENVSQETGYVLDRSLTIPNAAAPADLVGELVRDVASAIDAINGETV